MKLPQNRLTDIGSIPSPSAKVIERPELIWPSIPDSIDVENVKEHDRFTAPDHWIIKTRREFSDACKREESPGLGCGLFWEKLQESEQILILDKHFDKQAMITLRERLRGGRMKIQDLRIITSDDGARDLFSDIARLNTEGDWL
ncbi:hypothetical protein [Geotalea uraniireducens]|uniref:Uncharacterized protein n=1 Tax=Geotalea uraniireducens (strain Rf4) TaxID=351605 RepID=A5G5M3_GEOUR|nr:hypothetical protein [Geotalea uraniireducens]ABQ27091.1 hypothetical protein Gura_2919 [Geotalea uraniireducens Rf4]